MSVDETLCDIAFFLSLPSFILQNIHKSKLIMYLLMIFNPISLFV